MKLLRAILFVTALCSVWSASAVEIMPIEDLKPGMKGLTYTVLQGSEIVTLETEVLGVARNALGPGLNLIICKLIDPKSALCGAVHGMSGSPLYINGKLVGALSRRIAFFEKDGQCGFTPIADMLDVRDKMRKKQTESASAFKLSNAFSFFSPGGKKPLDLQAKMLTIPWSLSGISPGIWSQLVSALKLPEGFSEVLVSGGSTAQKPLGPETLKPGSALAAMLITGSISIAGTGTMTWREGDEILAFGHPMLGGGELNLPMGTAEIVTTVPSYEKPFKMSNPSQVVGSVLQDRMSAISGIVGQKPPMAPYKITHVHNGEKLPNLEGAFTTYAPLTPAVIAASMQGIFMQHQEISRQYTINIHGKLRIAGHTPLQLNGYYSGQDFDVIFIMLRFLSPVQITFGQRMESIRAEGLEMHIETTEKQQAWNIEEIRTDKKTLEPGATVRVSVELAERLGGRAVKSVEMKLPLNVKSGPFSVRAVSSEELERDSLNRSLDAAKDVEEIISLLNQRRAGNALYVQLVTSTPGEIIASKELTALPPSVREVMDSGTHSQQHVSINETVWQEAIIEVPGMVTGREQIQLEVKQ